MKNCKVRLEDQMSKKNWQKEGDFGLVAIGDRQGEGKGPLVEVDFSSLSEPDLSFLLATILKIAHNASPKAVQYSLVLFSQAVRGERPITERMEVDKSGLITNKSKIGGTDKGSSSKN